MDDYRTKSTPQRFSSSNLASSTPKSEVKNDWTFFSSSSYEKLESDSYDYSPSTSLKSFASDFKKELKEPLVGEIERNSKLEYDEDRFAKEHSDSLSSESENEYFDDYRNLSIDENSSINYLRNFKVISDFKDNSTDSSRDVGVSYHLSSASQASQNFVDYAKSYLFKSQSKTFDIDKIYSNNTELSVENYSPLSSSFETASESSQFDFSDSNACLSEQVSLNSVTDETIKNDCYLNEGINITKECPDIKSDSDISNCYKTEEETLMKFIPKMQISGSIVQEVDGCDSNKRVSSENCNNIPQPLCTEDESSFSLGNESQNALSHTEKEYSQEYNVKKENQSISTSLTPLKAGNYTYSNIVNYSPIKDCNAKNIQSLSNNFKLGNNDQTNEQMSFTENKIADVDSKNEPQDVSVNPNFLKDDNSTSSDGTYYSAAKDFKVENTEDNISENLPKREDVVESRHLMKPNIEIKALLQLFNVDNVIAREILSSLLSSRFSDGATINSMLNHIRNNVTESVIKLRNDIKTFFRAAIDANIIEMKRKRYFLKSGAKIHRNKVIQSKENVNKKSYYLRSLNKIR